MRMGSLGDPQDRYLGLIDTAAIQLTELLEDLSLIARIEGGRWEPLEQDADTLELARTAVETLGDTASVTGTGAPVQIDPAAASRAIFGLANAARRHGGLEVVEIEVDGTELRIGPLTTAAPIVLAEDLRDLGAALGRMVIEALGGSVELAGERLVVRLRG